MEPNRLKREISVLGVALLLGTGAALPAHADWSWDWATGPSLAEKTRAARKQEGRDWSIDLTTYLWAASMDGTMGIPPTGDIPVSSTFEGLRSKLSAGFAGIIDIRYRRWHIISDNNWLRLKDNVGVSILGRDTAHVELDSAFGTAGAAYELPLDKSFALDLYLAARWWYMSSAVNVSGTPPPLSGEAKTVWADAVVGARIRYPITDKWRVAFSGDVGAGQADLDWMVYGGLTYMFNDCIGATAGYRILGVDYSDSAFTYDMKMHGLVLGLNLAY